jgi:hypothetical protein
MRHLDIVDIAGIFAAADMSAADTIISVWYEKYVDGSWRPSTAINLADTDGNPATEPDPNWMPLRPDPAYPDYPSGYNGFAAAVTRALERVFHTHRLQLTLISTAVPDLQRQYETDAALRQDVVDARMWLGSTSAPRTRPPGTWGCGSPPGRSTTTSSASRRSDSQLQERSTRQADGASCQTPSSSAARRWLRRSTQAMPPATASSSASFRFRPDRCSCSNSWVCSGRSSS